MGDTSSGVWKSDLKQILSNFKVHSKQPQTLQL